MEQMEKQLDRAAQEFEAIEAPEEMELRLKNVLGQHKKRSRKFLEIGIAAVILLFFLNYNTIAFYGKQILGYENVMKGTLQELNKLGKGQEINKSFQFQDGTRITLDGAMLDDNRFLLFYTIESEQGDVDKIHLSPLYIKGWIKQYRVTNGQGLMNDEKTEIRWISNFEVPSFYEKELKLQVQLLKDGENQEGIIPFQLDWSKAMGSVLKKDLHKKIQVDHTDIYVKSILASPMSTVIKGSIGTWTEFVTESLRGEQMRANLELQLLANGEILPQEGSSISTSEKGIQFEQRFDALPTDLEKLQVQLLQMNFQHKIDQKIPLDIGMRNYELEIEKQPIIIQNVYRKDGYTCIDLHTEDDVLLYDIALIMDGESISLQDVTTIRHDKQQDGNITHDRTLRFQGTGEGLVLHIKRMSYTKTYNEVIDIPIR